MSSFRQLADEMDALLFSEQGVIDGYARIVTACGRVIERVGYIREERTIQIGDFGQAVDTVEVICMPASVGDVRQGDAISLDGAAAATVDRVISRTHSEIAVSVV